MQERLGIAGSGAIACGLAAVAAPHGEVVLWARSEQSAARARERLRGAGGHDMAPEVRVTTHLGALANASFVVEAVTEDREAKIGLYAQLHDELDPDAVLATTTSSLSVGDLAAASGRPDRFLGLHVFNPVEKMALVELVHHDEAADDVRARARALCEALGKTPVEVPDVPGFVVNRLLFPYLFSAVRLLEDTGLEPEHVDECMKLGAGHPMGPLAVLDLVGLDVAIAIAEQIELDVPGRVRELAADGALGRKAGRGFHVYE
ncbi:MAG TPA: 3-hydroxyacyl-CoA dehydrogenase family protein [Solirubrobacteraceae bacterium]|nr:3-hydroxyacyl-CoA dehydrogenase family protein [Solirubrobacteraceae bacterium]